MGHMKKVKWFCLKLSDIKVVPILNWRLLKISLGPNDRYTNDQQTLPIPRGVLNGNGPHRIMYLDA